MADSAGGLPDQGGPAELGGCPAGHARPARARSGWMCPRCGLRLMPMTAEECFEGHVRPEDSARWTAWVCPQDDELVLPEDMSIDDVFAANKNHPLLAQMLRRIRRDEPGSLGIDPNQGIEPLNVITFPPSGRPDAGPWPEPAQEPADPNDALVTIAAPILAGFSLAATVTIGTAAPAGPGALPAMACFAGSAVLLLFSIQMLAIARLGGLRTARWPRRIKALLYELGLLAFLVGLGLFLWLRTWPAAAVAGVAVVGLAVICDLALVVTAWCRRNQWGHRQLSLDTKSAAQDPHIGIMHVFERRSPGAGPRGYRGPPVTSVSSRAQ
jgi:hypothetical protein